MHQFPVWHCKQLITSSRTWQMHGCRMNPLLLLLNASATSLHQAICACLCWSAWMWSQKVQPYTKIPSYLAASCQLAWGGLGKRPLPALAAAQALLLLRLCPAHGVWRSLAKHVGMDSSLSTSCHSLWALPGCCGRGAGCWTWIRLCNFRQGPLAVAARRDPSQLTSLLYPPCLHPIPLPGNSLTSCFSSLPTRGQAMPCHGPPYTI